jgi:adenine deaminase
MEPQDLNAPDLRDRAVRAARGLAPFDVLITGGTVVDVATQDLRPADVGLVGPLIASVHPPGTRSDAARTVDATGRLIAPGLIDTHMHVESSMLTPRGYAEVVVPQGTTTICWDPHEVGNVLGLDGVRWAVAASRDLPLRGLELAGAEFNGPEMAEMLSWPEVRGVAEVMDMRGVLERAPKMRDVVGAGLASGKMVCGHGRGLEGADLIAFAAAGIESDHEITSGEDLVAKLRAGFTVELRGSHDYVLPGAVAALNALPAIPQTLTLCTDDIFPDDLVDKGGMIDLLRRLVGYGLAPVQAIRAATLNAAMRLGRRDLGLVAPGRRADLILLSDLSAMTVGAVFASGRMVACDGLLTEALRPDPAGAPTATVKVAPLSPDDFRLKAPQAPDGTVRLRAIRGARFTAWSAVSVPVAGGVAEVPADANLMAVVHRHGRRPAVPQVAVKEDWGVWRGALATTISHDSHNLTVFGRDPADMAAAANALVACGGGMAVAAGGQVTALLALPVCGLLSEAPATVVADGFRASRAAADAVAEWKPPYRVFKAVVGASLACNPGPHLTDLGLTDGTTGDVFEDAVIA